MNFSVPPNSLKDKVILITGAGAGIGRAVAKALALQGATIILLGKTISKLESIYDEIEAANCPTPAIYPMDLSGASEHDLGALIETINTTFHRLDGIIHNAAFFEALTPFDQESAESLLKAMQVNVNTPFIITQLALPLLKQSTTASIIFTTDSVGKIGKAYTGVYGISKFAVEGMAQILAEELEGTSVRVNRVEPMEVRSGHSSRIYPGKEIQKLAGPEDITAAYVYLMSDESQAVHGESITADTTQ
ncbi:MAG: YciK family oxidoreductase [Methylococcales bacterium]|jgi:NAD(P)-dependent dehydrogenase (short-subunit alcohol dehydrogenase family)|nr:YciK family oxidoreductase [Methylococcales bacterium]MBT7444874.1 YciK family oxidoreductase [Methylococcales bacterium]